MRVTAKVREQTRRSILDSSHELFCLVGFEVATTRDIARAAGVASGTVFNYFATKEAIAAALVMKQSSRIDSLKDDFESFEEALFALAAQTIRSWKRCRNYILPVLESTLSSLGEPEQNEVGSPLRLKHLKGVQSLALRFIPSQPLTSLEMHLYWTLLFGVIAFWVHDNSRKQEETLALLDQSIGMFVSWIESGSGRSGLVTQHHRDG